MFVIKDGRDYFFQQFHGARIGECKPVFASMQDFGVQCALFETEQAAKDVVAEISSCPGMALSPRVVDLRASKSEVTLQDIIDVVVAANTATVACAVAGKEKAVHALIGQTMKAAAAAGMGPVHVEMILQALKDRGLGNV